MKRIKYIYILSIIILITTGCSKEKKAKEELGSLNIPINEEALRVYAARGDEKVVKLLLNAGIAADRKDSNDRTALSAAIFFKNYDILKLLVDNGASVNTMFTFEKETLTPFQFFIFSFVLKEQAINIEIVKYFVSHGLDLNKIFSSHQFTNLTPLSFVMVLAHQVKSKNKNVANSLWETAGILLDAGASPDIEMNGGDFGKSTSLNLAIVDEQENLAERMLTKVSDLNALHSIDGLNPSSYLHQSISPSAEMLDLAEKIIKTGKVSLDYASDDSGFTALHYAAMFYKSSPSYKEEEKWANLIKILIKSGADVKIKTKASNNPGEFASGGAMALNFLINDLRANENNHKLKKHHLELIELMLKNGADPYTKPISSISAYEQFKKFDEAKELLALVDKYTKNYKK